MTDEWPDHLDDRDEYDAWVEHLADNARQAAAGQAADAGYIGDLADATAARIESEVDLEVGDKLDVLTTERTPFDVLRLTERSPTADVPDRTRAVDSIHEAAIELAHDALYQDVLATVHDELGRGQPQAGK